MQGILEDAARPYEPYELQSQQRPSQPNRTFKHTSFVGMLRVRCVCICLFSAKILGYSCGRLEVAEDALADLHSKQSVDALHASPRRAL